MPTLIQIVESIAGFWTLSGDCSALNEVLGTIINKDGAM